MNLSNKLTISRVVFIPFVVALMFRLPEYIWGATQYNDFQIRYGMGIALFLFILASLTDFFDGHLARKNSWVTNFGKFLDPIADKLLVLSILIAFTGKNYITALIPILTLARDFVVTGLRLLAAEQNVVIAANKGGKVKTFVQMLAIIATFVYAIMYPYHSLSNIENVAFFYLYNILLWLSLLLGIQSAYEYIKEAKQYLKN